MRVEGIGQCEGHTCSTHQHVGEGQVSDEKVGDVVHLACAANDVKKQVVSKDAHQSNQGVTGDDEQLEGLQQLNANKLGVALGGAVLQSHLKHLSRVVPCDLVRHTLGGEPDVPTTLCALHADRLMETWRRFDND